MSRGLNESWLENWMNHLLRMNWVNHLLRIEWITFWGLSDSSFEDVVLSNIILVESLRSDWDTHCSITIRRQCNILEEWRSSSNHAFTCKNTHWTLKQKSTCWRKGWAQRAEPKAQSTLQKHVWSHQSPSSVSHGYCAREKRLKQHTLLQWITNVENLKG